MSACACGERVKGGAGGKGGERGGGGTTDRAKGRGLPCREEQRWDEGTGRYPCGTRARRADFSGVWDDFDLHGVVGF